MSNYSDSEDSAEYSLEEVDDISDEEESCGEVEGNNQGEHDIQQRGTQDSYNSEIEQDEDNKKTSLIKEQQHLIENLRKELESLKAQRGTPSESCNRKYAPKSDESTSAVVSSFEDDDDELDSLSSEESSMSGEHGNSVPNPLLVDVVIQKVMDHLPLSSLLEVRVVCRKWNRMATYQIANKCGPILLEVYQPWKPSRGIKVSTFIDVMRNSFCCPFSKFSISSFTALEELDRFFFHFGRYIKHLDLNFPEGFSDSQSFVLLLLRKIPHVESLRIGCCQMFKQLYLVNRPTEPETWPYENKLYLRNLKTFCVGNIVNMVPSKVWLQAFFKMTPNLEKLVLHVNFKENGNTFIRTILESLVNLPVLANIKNLMISCLTESHLRTLIKLAECGLHLKHFKFQDLCLHLTEISGAVLETFLSAQAGHLESLEIEQSSNFPRIRAFQIPAMKFLKSFSVVSSQRISFGALNYSSHLPKLERLTLRGFDVFNCAHVFQENESRSRAIIGQYVRVLSLPSKLDIPNFPRVLRTMFPNVTDLEVRGVTNECLKDIWESWPRLQKFKLVVSHFDDNIDSGLTGIPDEICSELRSNTSIDSDSELQDLKTSTAITDLPCLHTFELECRAMWIPCQIITDVTGYYALTHLSTLKRLKVTEIGVPEKFDLSNECIQAILNALQDADVTFKIMDDHGRWQLDLGRADVLRNTYESEPQLEDHNKDREYVCDKMLRS